MQKNDPSQKQPFKLEDVQDDTYISQSSPFGLKSIIATFAVLLLILLAFFIAQLMIGHPSDHQTKQGQHDETTESLDGPSEITLLTADNFDEITRSGIVLVDFWMHGCTPCDNMVPNLEKVARTMKGKAVVAKINGPENRAINNRYGISAYPTILLFHNGKQVDYTMGYQTEAQLKSMIDWGLELESKAKTQEKSESEVKPGAEEKPEPKKDSSVVP